MPSPGKNFLSWSSNNILIFGLHFYCSYFDIYLYLRCSHLKSIVLNNIIQSSYYDKTSLFILQANWWHLIKAVIVIESSQESEMLLKILLFVRCLDKRSILKSNIDRHFKHLSYKRNTLFNILINNFLSFC